MWLHSRSDHSRLKVSSSAQCLLSAYRSSAVLSAQTCSSMLHANIGPQVDRFLRQWEGHCPRIQDLTTCNCLPVRFHHSCGCCSKDKGVFCKHNESLLWIPFETHGAAASQAFKTHVVQAAPCACIQISTGRLWRSCVAPSRRPPLDPSTLPSWLT